MSPAAIFKISRAYREAHDLEIELAGTELFKHCAAHFWNCHWGSLEQCKADVRLLPYGRNACTEVPEISQFAEQLGLQQRCTETDVLPDAAKVAYFNPVFCHTGVRLAAEQAEAEDNCIIAPQLKVVVPSWSGLFPLICWKRYTKNGARTELSTILQRALYSDCMMYFVEWEFVCSLVVITPDGTQLACAQPHRGSLYCWWSAICASCRQTCTRHTRRRCWQVFGFPAHKIRYNIFVYNLSGYTNETKQTQLSPRQEDIISALTGASRAWPFPAHMRPRLWSVYFPRQTYGWVKPAS